MNIKLLNNSFMTGNNLVVYIAKLNLLMTKYTRMQFVQLYVPPRPLEDYLCLAGIVG